MITLDDLFSLEPPGVVVAQLPAANPFRDVDALLESQILDIRYDAIRSTLGVIFELRMSYHLRETSTGLLVASNITEFSWSQVDRPNDRTAWTVYGSKAARIAGGLSLELDSSPNAKLVLNAERASFYQLKISDLEDVAPPDYGEPDFADIRKSIATWNSNSEIVAAVHSQPSGME
jgi:hypothetical protein